jgi:hypothetical protein
VTPPVETRQAPTVEGTPQPGLQIWGWVRLDAQDAGSGLAGVQIFRAYASYPGEVAATSAADGSYQSPFYGIPGDEMVRVWAELPGYVIEPEWEGCDQGVCSWRHYYGTEIREFNFVARRP